ncbi:MAG: type 2 isopentenyl-diphosphate Delta-isomerase [Anaerolineaceae bacterium]|nr:type 2 isopentenyl-diphosphate Delta-isomerase [Anaerolineaceae bacterium]
MNKVPQIEQRKKDHIAINLNKDINSDLTNGLEKYQLLHCALPELDLVDVDASSTFFNKLLSYPVLISSMTGGTKESEKINRNLAHNAQSFHLAMGVGSQRAGLENDASMQTFKVRQYAPDILLFANLGAVQLNYSYTIEHCKKIVDAVEADALILHLNPLQESIMEDGNTNFSGLLAKIELVCKKLPVPVVVKEVGWGISGEVAKQLANAGVQAIDVAGAGGTSWSEVEKHRTSKAFLRETAGAFKDWGIPTAECIIQTRQALPSIPLIASGGLRNGVDIAKCIALGANMGGMARQFLASAADSEDTLHTTTLAITRQFRIAMFGVGARNLNELRINKISRIK